MELSAYTREALTRYKRSLEGEIDYVLEALVEAKSNVLNLQVKLSNLKADRDAIAGDLDG